MRLDRGVRVYDGFDGTLARIEVSGKCSQSRKGGSWVRGGTN